MKLPHWLAWVHRSRSECPECGESVRDTYCKVCGYDLVRQTRNAVPPHSGV